MVYYIVIGSGWDATMDINKIRKFFGFRMYRVSWVMLYIFVTLFIGDLVSTLRVGEFIKYLEANPIYKVFGMAGIIFMNFMALYMFLRLYHKKQANHLRYFLCTAFVYLSITRISVIFSNWTVGNQVMSGEVTREMAMAVTEATKQNTYWLLMLGILVPIFFAMFNYILFSLDHNIEFQRRE